MTNEEIVMTWHKFEEDIEDSIRAGYRLGWREGYAAGRESAKALSQEPTIHCNCTDEEIAQSFIEDVEAVKELLPQAESEKV